jgi:outer membrane lipoprotein SlyB
MNKLFKLTVLGLSTLIIASCAPRLGGSDYTADSVGDPSRTVRGTIVAMRTINIGAQKENQPGVGALAGGVAGAIAGTQFGGGRGRVATTGLGALAGAGAGHIAERYLTDQEGFEYQVETETGELLTIAQGKEPAMSVGQHVLVIVASSKGHRSRIIPDTSGR